MAIRPRRSLLYMPGSNARALDKARSLPADGLILDLEDAVAPDAKALAREQIIATLAEGGYGHRELLVRVHALSTPWGADDLRGIARNHLRRHRAAMTLNTTAVVHEAYLKIADGHGRWQHRAHFYALASTAMRQLLVDHARRRHADKRGGGAVHVTLSESSVSTAAPAIDVLSLDAALRELAALDPILERVVECRFFAGLSVAETAEALGRSQRSIERDWARARAHLFESLASD